MAANILKTKKIKLNEIKNQEKLMHTVKNIYLETGKLSEEKLTELMKHDLWMDSPTVLSHGFADEIK